MYSKFPLKVVGITDNFGMRKHPISGVSTKHYGLDLGWINYKGEPVIAAHDGVVVQEGYDSGLGNYVVIRFTEGNNVIINRYLHLKNRALVKKGNSVKQSTVIGYMGDTGYADGVHLHFEYWVCPKGYTYKSSDVSRYARDPLDYCYLFDDQKVTSASSKVKRVVGTPVSKNSKKDQIRVIKKYLNCRSLGSLSGKILGFANLGYYNILDSKVSGKNTWYKIASGKWVADVSEYVDEYFVKKEDTVLVDETEEKDDSTTTDNGKINDKDLSTEAENTDSVISDDVILFDDYSRFISPGDDYYYIYLKKGESIYFPK